MSARLEITLRAASVRRGDKWALRDVSAAFRSGERWALLGDNGSGKTQLLKLLSGDVWPTPGEDEAERRYSRGGRRVELIDAKPHIAYIGAESQDKYARYEWNLVGEELIATGLHGTDLLLKQVTPRERARVNAVLRRCGLTRFAKRRFLTLSYGEKRLMLLARALVGVPDWLLLDEFYNGLDRRYRTRIDGILKIAHRRGQAWVASAHRASDVPAGTNWVLELEEGRVVRQGKLTRRHVESLAERAGEGGRVAFRPSQGRRRGQAVVKLEGIDLFVEYRAVLRGIDWALHAGEHWAVTGANGAGKSSFLKLLYGDIAPALGGILRRTGFPAGTPIAAWKRVVGLVSPELQTTYLIDTSLTELVASGRYSSVGLNDALSPADSRLARRWLKFFELEQYARHRPRELSYGQLRRALVARAMAGNPKVLLLDEPLTGLDPGQRRIMKRLLEKLMRRKVSIVAAVHHLEDLPRGMTHVLHLHKHRARVLDQDSAT
jgi:molybdate transport system ATP-binding protein